MDGNRHLASLTEYLATKDVVEMAGSLFSAVKSIFILNLQLIQAMLPTSPKALVKFPA